MGEILSARQAKAYPTTVLDTNGGHFRRVPLNFCGYAILYIVVSSLGTLRAVVGVLYFFAKRV